MPCCEHTNPAECPNHGVRVRPAPVRESDPVVVLVYELMRRGSVVYSTMKQVVAQINEGRVGVLTAEDEHKLDEARELCRTLPWYSGA